MFLNKESSLEKNHPIVGVVCAIQMKKGKIELAVKILEFVL